ncbi:hypothetical protein RUM43_003742, partial [Polyplax serrata]
MIVDVSLIECDPHIRYWYLVARNVERNRQRGLTEKLKGEQYWFKIENSRGPLGTRMCRQIKRPRQKNVKRDRKRLCKLEMKFGSLSENTMNESQP